MDNVPAALGPAYVDASAKERVLLAGILAGGAKGRTREQMAWDLYGNDPNGGPDDPDGVVKVLMCRLRKRLHVYGLTILSDAKQLGHYYIVRGKHSGRGSRPLCTPADRINQ